MKASAAKVLKRIGFVLAWCVATTGRLLFAGALLFTLVVWALGTRGVPLTVDLAQKLLGDQLTVAHAEGGLFGPIVLEGVVIDSQGSRTEIDRLRLDWSPTALWRRTVQVDVLDVGHVVVQQKPDVDDDEPPQPLTPRLPVDVTVREARLARFEQRPVEGRALVIEQVSASAHWRKDVVTLEALQLQQAEVGPVRARGRAKLAPKTITVESLHIEGPGTLQASGVVGLLGETSDLRATLTEGRWPVQGVAQVRVPQLSATARGVLSGAPLQLALTLQGALRTAVQEQALGFDLDGSAQLKDSGLTLERLSVKSTQGAGALEARGEAEWQPALRVNALAEIQQLNPGLLLPEWKGQLNGQLTAETTEGGEAPQVRFTAKLDRSTLRGYPLQLDARGTAALQGETQVVQIDAITLASGGTTLKAQGALLPTLDATLSLDARDLKTLLPSLGGAVQLTASARGEPTHPVLNAQGSVRGLRYTDTALAEATLDLDYAPGKDSRASLIASGVQSGTLRLSRASVLAEGRAERHTVTLKASATQPKSEATVTLAGRYDLAAARWQGQLQQSALTPPYGPPMQQEGPGALTLSAQQQRLEATCWRGGGARLCLDATLAAPSTRIAYRLEQLDTGLFAALLPKDWVLKTELNGRGVVAFEGAEPRTLDLDLDIAPGRIALPGAPPLQLLPSTVTVREAGGQWQAVAKLAVDRGTLSAEALLPTTGAALAERPLSGQVALNVPDLAWLTPLLPQVQDVRGRLSGAFTLAGSAIAPQLTGGLTLAEGSARVPAAGIALKDITAEVRGGSSGALQITASATSGGTLTVQGTADFASGTPVVKLNIDGDTVQVADIADARAWVSPALVYLQDAEGLSLTGTVKVPKADITPRKLAANAIGATGDQVLVGAEALAIKNLPLSAEVRIELGDKVTFEGFGLKSRITGAVTAIDRPGSGGTRGRGELELVDAAYKAYGQEIQVATGRILFIGGPIAEPQVDIVAKRSPREDVTVSLRVRGTLDQPTFDLSSNPAMPREQQLGWLLFGRPIDSGDGEFSGAAAALSLGIAGGDALASRIGKVIGLDQVSLGADASSSAWESSETLPGQPGTDQTRFTVGKYLSPKLFVSYGVGLFDNGNVLRLLYDLGQGFKLRTEAGLESGGDLLYSVEK